MARVVCLFWLVGAIGVGPPSVSAQAERMPAPGAAERTVVNLFETLDPSSPVDGARLELPDGWTVQEVYLLRYGTSSVPVRLQSGREQGVVFLTPSSSIQGPHELVVRVDVGDRTGTHRWHLTPFTLPVTSPAQPRDSLDRRMRLSDRLTRTVEIASSSRPSGSNLALALTDATASPSLQVPADRAPSRSRPFTVEFWVRTHGLDQVILSSWTGDEETPYPLEFVTDQGGRLRFYCGRAGRHQALRSTAPVADGQWHHAAVVHDATESRLHLLLDGTVVDSVQTKVLPTHSGALSLALGGRRRAGPERGAPSSAQRFVGRLDELRIWPSAREASTIRQTRTRPFPPPAAEDTDPFRLSFNDDAPRSDLDAAGDARRVPTHLSFQPPLRRLRARTDGESVTLRWDAQGVADKTADAGEFIIERSLDGTSFTPVDRLPPSEADASPPGAAQTSGAQEFTYTDDGVPGQVVFYRVRYASSTSDVERNTSTIKIGLGGKPTPERAVNLVGNFPNPFKKSTTIAYQVEASQPITLTIWNLSGKRITTLTSGVHEPGYYEQTLTADGLPSGTYFARLETPEGIQSARMVLLK
ncbi:LamG-like jellyroll fold domain-containing protein [Salinibacter grassmerensis]|uniref:LamG-like jellyroll fold domain-containing protein n=1 Tax=Salinibacter grassmerensis TaxID=3040353 RepID=UPI0021E98EFD|nr:LamG-like jellyroll fold domain-containing protein [Salinibacter grassmerensis]